LFLLFSCHQKSVNHNSLFLSPKKDKKIVVEEQEGFTSIVVQASNWSSKKKMTILSINTEKEEIETYWLNNETIQIEYPMGPKITVKKNKLEIFKKGILINHSPFKYAKIINQTNDNLNRATPLIKIQVGEKNYNKALMLVNERQERIALSSDKLNRYEYGNLYVDEGRYRILILGRNSIFNYTKYFNIPSGKMVTIELE